nr:hypothetical protein [uncultured Cohaesibacter sp.]
MVILLFLFRAQKSRKRAQLPVFSSTLFELMHQRRSDQALVRAFLVGSDLLPAITPANCGLHSQWLGARLKSPFSWACLSARTALTACPDGGPSAVYCRNFIRYACDMLPFWDLAKSWPLMACCLIIKDTQGI